MVRKLIILLKKDYGQLGNRLHTHSNIIAWCLEHGYPLLNLSFLVYANQFSTFNNYPIDRLWNTSSISQHLLRFSPIIKLLNKISLSQKWLKRFKRWIFVLDIEDNHSLSEITLNKHVKLHIQKKIILIRAWDLSCPHLVTKHQNQIRKIFTPKAVFEENAQLKITGLRKKFDCVVGVHARRGDYKEYLGGIHFHSWNSYRNWIIQTQNLIEGNGKGRVGFLLCSDENPQNSKLDDLPVSFGDSKSVITDLYALSLCDYNIGPPSSFGTWLSWHGRVPRFQISKGAIIECIDQFVISSEC